MKTNTYTFKEICNETGFNASAVRYYEKDFNIDIPRDKSGRRIFTENELKIFLNIKSCKDNGMSNKEIKELISKPDIEEISESGDAEIALTSNTMMEDSDLCLNNSLIKNYFSNIDDRLININSSIYELNKTINSEEKDTLISENLKLKLELKEKSYEVIELRNKLKYETQKKKGFFSRIFKK